MKRKSNTQKFFRGLLSLLVIFAALGLIGGARTASAGNCMQDLVSFGLNCTANDVSIAVYNKVGGPPVCFPGEYITVQLEADLVATANERYDIGMFIALDGGNALTGTCHEDWLPPPLSATPTPVNSTRTAPFYNAEATEDPNDTCGDLEQGVHNLRDLPTLTFKCQDRNNDGFADIDTCTSWDNGKSDGSKSKPSCTSVSQTLPSTPSKCRCEAVKIAGIAIGGKIIIYKATDPPGDPTSFTFSLTGGPDSVNVPFSLTDGTSFTSDALKPGTYSVTESVPSGWNLTSSTCSNGNSPSNISLQANETITCTFNDGKTVTENPTLTVKKSSTTTLVTAAGQIVPYNYLVTNAGNVTVTGISVTDNRVASVNCPSTSLAVGASMTCSGSHTVTLEEMNAGGNLTNIVTVSSSAPTVADTLNIPISQAPHVTLSKNAAPLTYSKVGDVVSYTLVASNDGNVTLTGVSISDPTVGALSCTPAQPATLAPGAALTCTGSHTITQSDLDSGSLINTATASGSGPEGQSVSDTKSATVNAVQNPHLTLTKSADPSNYSKTGDIIDYTLIVTNDGNVTLSNLSITDAKLGTLACTPSQPATLAPGAVLTCTGSHTIIQSDLDNGSLTNTATASGSGPEGQSVSDTASATVNAVQNPHLTLSKSGTLDMTIVSPLDRPDLGDRINYTLSAVNDGNITLNNVSISDPLLGTVTCTPAQPATLAPGSTLTCTGVYILTQTDINAGKVDNTATADSDQTGQVTTTTDVPLPTNPGLMLIKSASPATYDTVGQTVTYHYEIKNIGNVTLSGPFLVTDNKPLIGGGNPVAANTPFTCGTGPLDPSVSTSCDATYTITQNDLDNGSITNTAKASTSYNGNTITSDPSTVTVTAIQTPELTVKKSSTTASVTAAGQAVPYSYLVTNIGNVTVTGISLSDNKAAPVSCPKNSLAPSESMTCTGSHTVTQTEMDAGGNLTNTVTVTSANAPTVTDTLNIPITQAPQLALTKSASPATYSSVGQTIAYTYTIKNIGNVTLAGPFSVTDSKLGIFSCGSEPLAPAASTTCTKTYSITQADLDAGSITNNATASTSYNGNTVTSNQATATVTAIQVPKLTLAKSASPTTYSSVGQTIAYTYTITNSGNVTLAGPFTVTDSKLGTFTCGSGPLVPAASTSCTKTYTIAQADLDAGSITNTATVSGNGVTSPSTSATVNAVQTPYISLTKTAVPATYSNVGDTINYTLVAKNDGNVTLYNVSISDAKLGTLTCSPSQPTTLAPGATLTCTGSHTTTQADVPKFTNTANVSGKGPQGQSVSATATATVNIYPKGVMTDTMLCTLPNNQFKLVFTPDQNAQNSWKLNASNPGQYYYNIFYVGAGNEDIKITLPYAWVTQGAVPIHVYSNVGVATNSSGGYCLTPTGELSNETDQVTLANYSPQTFGSTTTVTIHIPALPGGFAYINIHLDYGLKGTTGYAKGGPSGNDAVKAGTSTVLIPDNQSYSLSDTKGGGAIVTSINSFKKDPGIGGLVLNTDGDPVKNAKVQIFQGTSKTASANVYTDDDGWYMWQYKWTGKAASFVVKMTPPLPYKQTTQSQSVTLKANGYLVVNFTVPLP